MVLSLKYQSELSPVHQLCDVVSMWATTLTVSTSTLATPTVSRTTRNDILGSTFSRVHRTINTSTYHVTLWSSHKSPSWYKRQLQLSWRQRSTPVTIYTIQYRTGCVKLSYRFAPCCTSQILSPGQRIKYGEVSNHSHNPHLYTSLVSPLHIQLPSKYILIKLCNNVTTRRRGVY